MCRLVTLAWPNVLGHSGIMFVEFNSGFIRLISDLWNKWTRGPDPHEQPLMPCMGSQSSYVGGHQFNKRGVNEITQINAFHPTSPLSSVLMKVLQIRGSFSPTTKLTDSAAPDFLLTFCPLSQKRLGEATPHRYSLFEWSDYWSLETLGFWC